MLADGLTEEISGSPCFAVMVDAVAEEKSPGLLSAVLVDALTEESSSRGCSSGGAVSAGMPHVGLLGLECPLHSSPSTKRTHLQAVPKCTRSSSP